MGNVELCERFQRRQFRLALAGGDEIDLVHADHGPRAAAEDGDEKAVDEARPQGRRLQRDDIHHDVDVGRDEPLHVGIERIGARQHRMARQERRGCASSPRPPLPPPLSRRPRACSSGGWPDAVGGGSPSQRRRERRDSVRWPR